MPSHQNPDVQITHTHIASATNGLQSKENSKSKALVSRVAGLKSKSRLLRQFVLFVLKKQSRSNIQLWLRGNSITAGNAVQGAEGEAKKKVNMGEYPRATPKVPHAHHMQIQCAEHRQTISISSSSELVAASSEQFSFGG